MNPSILLTILNGFQAAINAAPTVIELATKAKEFFGQMFSSGLISKAQQDALMLSIDSHAAMVNAGIVPDHWRVEQDPVP